MEAEKKTLEEARRNNFIQYLQSKEPGYIYQRYVTAVEAQDEEEAAEAARAYRNSLLDGSDSMLVIDRPNVNTEAWETYRQALRDVPEQEGFPLNIVWPEKP